MPAFNNMATLSYNNTIINSNIVQGQITDVLNASKTAVFDEYTVGDTVTYAISIVNSGTAAYNGLTVSDNLGEYPFGAETRIPLDYVEGSARVYVNGVLQPAPTVTADPLTITGINVPAGGNVLVLYSAVVNRFAPLASGGLITNTASIDGDSLSAPIVVSADISASESPRLTISKSISPSTIAENGTIQYTFVIQNTGNTPVVATDNAVVTDMFETFNDTLTVTLDGVPLTSPAQYTYDDSTGAFSTVPGVITVPAATYTQDPITGVWTITPGVTLLTITATGVQVRG